MPKMTEEQEQEIERAQAEREAANPWPAGKPAEGPYCGEELHGDSCHMPPDHPGVHVGAHTSWARKP